MRKIVSAIILVMIFLAATDQAQDGKPRYSVFGGKPDERACVRIEYFDNVKKIIQQAAIDYGTPVWKKEYEDPKVFDRMTQGKIWRMGSNFWSRLESYVPLKIAGKRVPAGMWYIGLRRSAEGNEWTLVLIDPAKARAAGIYDAFRINEAPVEISAPMTVEKPTEIKEKLTVTITPQKDEVKNATVRIAWGQLQLSTPIEVELPN
jgi:hypothetical protein